MNRIRDRIDHEFENLLWLGNNMPEILTDSEWELEELGAIRNRRLKLMLQIVKAIYPDADPELRHYETELGFTHQS